MTFLNFFCTNLGSDSNWILPVRYRYLLIRFRFWQINSLLKTILLLCLKPGYYYYCDVIVVVCTRCSGSELDNSCMAGMVLRGYMDLREWDKAVGTLLKYFWGWYQEKFVCSSHCCGSKYIKFVSGSWFLAQFGYGAGPFYWRFRLPV